MRCSFAVPVAVLGWAAWLTPVSAQSFAEANQRLEIAGVAPAACVLRPPQSSGGTNATFDATGTASGEVRIGQMVRPDTAEPLPTSIELAFPVTCNASHVVGIRSQNGGLLRINGDVRNRAGAGGFGEFLPYSIALDWAGQQRAATSETAQNLVINAARGASGDARLRFELAGGGGPLAAGRYEDSIVIEFQAAN